MNVIEIKLLSFSYRNKRVLDNLEIAIPQGSICGLLGRNGAGKTTMIKLMLGLLPSNAGTIYYHGLDFDKHRIALLQCIGTLVETPSLYAHLSCWEQLQYLNFYFRQPLSRIDEILTLVGLANEEQTKIKHCSTGMKQRLAIAVALFNHPDILILDEPLNGLDPSGIYDMRNLFRQLQQSGITILLSSHIISEVEKICTHVAILEQGEIRYCKDVDMDLEQMYLNIVSSQNHYEK
ncbi:MAG: ATP-binding cassette domain-containing protein [Bacteroidales bacterium]|jgi:ABC-2 type transport system ATP-binding protein|nr:ATP-binding cassette domain-containing protein [Bacteroidales bacterium]